MLVGLGNPGREYASTRHNIGFIFLDYLAGARGVQLKSSKWQAYVAKDVLCGRQMLFVKPDTYMNNSGVAVGMLASYFQVMPEKIIVVHDDLDLPLGRIKVTTRSGAGGHNGIRSIITHLGSKDFLRIKVGVGRPQVPVDISQYVLSTFSAEEKAIVPGLLSRIEEGVLMIVEQGVQAAMNLINSEK